MLSLDKTWHQTALGRLESVWMVGAPCGLNNQSHPNPKIGQRHMPLTLQAYFTTLKREAFYGFLMTMADQAVPNINILSFKQHDESSIGKFLTWSLQYGRIIIIITEFIVIAAFISRFYFDRRLSDLKDQIDVKTKFIAESQGVEKDFIKLKATLDQAGSIIDNRKDYSIVVANVNALKPEDFVIRDLNIDNKVLTVSGDMGSIASLYTFIQALNTTDKFSDPSIEDIALKDNQLVLSARATIQQKAFTQ